MICFVSQLWTFRLLDVLKCEWLMCWTMQQQALPWYGTSSAVG